MNIAYCTCDKDYIESLRTKLISDQGLDISEVEQTDVSKIVDASLEKYNLELSAPGKQLELSHLDTELQNKVNALCAT